MDTDYVLHVGVILKDHLDNLNITKQDLSEKAGISINIINEILNGKRDIDSTHAMKFEEAFKTPAKVWLDFQKEYDEAIKNNSKSFYVTALEN